MIRKTMMETAMYYLSEKNCSEKQLRFCLEQEFANTKELENLQSTLKRLSDLGLIHDKRIARSLAERFSHKGDRFIIDLLQKEGINEKLIKETLAKLGNEYERAWPEAMLKLAQWKHDSLQQRKNKITRFLRGRHFSFTTIGQVINQWQEDEKLKETAQLRPSHLLVTKRPVKKTIYHRTRGYSYEHLHLSQLN